MTHYSTQMIVSIFSGLTAFLWSFQQELINVVQHPDWTWPWNMKWKHIVGGAEEDGRERGGGAWEKQLCNTGFIDCVASGYSVHVCECLKMWYTITWEQVLSVDLCNLPTWLSGFRVGYGDVSIKPHTHKSKNNRKSTSEWHRWFCACSAELVRKLNWILYLIFSAELIS